MRIFLAGASGVIGTRLIPLLIKHGHTVAGMTRSPEKAGLLGALGAQPVVCDVFDTAALTGAMAAFRPELVFSQLTDLPDRVEDIPSSGDRNSRIRTDGIRSLVAAAAAAGAARVIAQSVSWELPAGRGRAATAELERVVLDAAGVVIRYGQFWGPGTFYPDRPPDPPRVHVDDAARGSLPALAAPAGVTLVVDDRAAPPRTA